MDLKFSESVRGRLEDFLEVECLVGDICTRKNTTKRNKCKNTKTEHKLDLCHVSPKHKHKDLKQNTTVLKHASNAKPYEYYQNAKQ